MEEIEVQHKNADKITLVMDNLNTHIPGSLYETFPPPKAKALWDRFEFVYTPKHGSWLNMAEIELNVLTGQCLKRRMDNIELRITSYNVCYTKLLRTLNGEPLQPVPNRYPGGQFQWLLLF